MYLTHCKMAFGLIYRSGERTVTRQPLLNVKSMEYVGSKWWKQYNFLYCRLDVVLSVYKGQFLCAWLFHFNGWNVTKTYCYKTIRFGVVLVDNTTLSTQLKLVLVTVKINWTIWNRKFFLKKFFLVI